MIDAETTSLMDLHVTSLGTGAVEIAPVGELHQTDLGELRSQLLDWQPNADRILVDLSKVERIDPAATALLMLARIETEARGGRFVVLAGRSRVRGALRRAGIERFVQIVASRTEALSALGRPPLDAAA